MGSRERKRAELRKRKRRQPGQPDTALDDGAGDGAPPSRSELKDLAARDALEPLREGERPLVVTIGAVVSALIASSIVVAYAAGAEVDGERPELAQIVAPSLLMAVMAFGMWRARYWAVLGFQAVLLFLILATAVGLVQATRAVQVAGNVTVLAVAGAFFYFMVRALARIQMPERLPRK